MEVAAFVFSLFAITLAAGSFALGIRNDRRQQRAEERDTRRHQREEAEADARRRTRPVVEPTGGSGGPTADKVRHHYKVHNAGEATISALWLWIEDEAGKVVSTTAGGTLVLTGESPPAPLTVEVAQPLPETQILMVRWNDPDGTHTERTGILPPRHM